MARNGQREEANQQQGEGTRGASEGRGRRVEDRRGGPVFPVRRPLSAAARQILEAPLDTERVTAYDKIWFTGRPVV